MFFPLFVIEPFEHEPLETAMMSGPLELKDTSPIFSGGKIRLSRNPILVKDFQAVICKDKNIARLMAFPYDKIRDAFTDPEKPLWFFVLYQNEVFVFKGATLKNLSEREIDGEKYAVLTVPFDRCIYGWSAKH